LFRPWLKRSIGAQWLDSTFFPATSSELAKRNFNTSADSSSRAESKIPDGLSWRLQLNADALRQVATFLQIFSNVPAFNWGNGKLYGFLGAGQPLQPQIFGIFFLRRVLVAKLK